MGIMKGVVVHLIMVIGVLVYTVSSESEPNQFAPELNMKDTDGKDVDVYRGFIVVQEDTVSLVPELSATDKDALGGARFICGYNIVQDTPATYEIPFEAHVLSHLDGKSTLKVKAGVDLSKLTRNKYKFQISAFDCGSPTLHSQKAHVVVQVLRLPEPVTPPLPSDIKSLIDNRIKVVDHQSTSTTPEAKEELHMKHPPLPPVHDSTPVEVASTTSVYPKLKLEKANTVVGGEQFFARKSYIIAMREGTLYDNLLKLKPADGQSIVNICGYEVITPDVPFAVDNLGNVRNTKPLNTAVQKSYILSVVAKHCDGLVSKPALINVQVSEICSNGWKELPTDEEYRAGSKAIHPFSKTWFDTCTTSCKDDESMAVTVALESGGKINTCEHDAYSIQSQRNTCGTAPNTVELLPKGQPWTKTLTPVEGHDAAYKFDGKTAVKVPSDQSNHTLGEFFTIATWMQHKQEKKDGHKEHIMCNADGDGMNRHHYAFFVHNCRLVFLLRKEADQVASLDKFQPAEWRWTIPQVCDSKWHHYALSVTYPHAKLYVDGQPIQADKNTVEVVDDWALHPSDKVSFQQLTVGGCWKGETQKFGQFFDGYLAGLTMLQGTTETERAVKCLNSCGEKLEFHAMDQLTVGMSVSFNTELTELTIRGKDVEDVKKVLHQVGYTNTNGKPKTGYRTLHVKTSAMCDGKPLPVNEQTIPIMVTEVTDPKITIAGVKSKLRTAKEFAQGVDLFTELMILSNPEKELSGQENKINKIDIEDVNMLQKDLKKKLLLNRCEVQISPKMDKGHETLRLPTSLLVKYLMDSQEFDEGFIITGTESFAEYENVLRETFYMKNNVDKSFTPRRFNIKCSGMNGQFVSNLFTVELGVMDEVRASAQLYADPQLADLKAQKLSVNVNAPPGVQATVVSGGGTSGTVIAVVVVCLAFLVGVIALAVVRIRNVQRRRKNNPNMAVEDGPEMEWDNSTLNVTVNPFESDALMQEIKPDTTIVCDSEEEVMSSEDEDDTPKDGGLEWDNSSY